MKKYLMVLLSSIVSGALIAIGATAYLMCLSADQKYLGAFLFGTGLYSIIVFELWLYTGKVGHVLDNKADYVIDLIICVIGNMLGVFILAFLISFTRNGDTLKMTSEALVNTKQNDSWYSMLILSIMCGMMIYLAVVGNKKCGNIVGRIVIPFFAIVIFILCGFEHCVANVAYYTYAGRFDGFVFLYFIIMIIGNAIGSIALDYSLKLVEKFKDKKVEDIKNED